MWHEARKQEKVVRKVIVDYRKRAERRHQYYDKIKQDPTKFMQVRVFIVFNFLVLLSRKATGCNSTDEFAISRPLGLCISFSGSIFNSSQFNLLLV